MADQQDVQNQQAINDLYEKRAKLAKSISDIEAKALKAQGEFLTSIEKKAIIAQNELKLQQDIVSAISIKQKAEKERRRKMLDSIGRDAYNGVDLFEGTPPVPAQASGGGQGALSGVEPGDKGVDISNIPGMNNWKHLIK